MYVLLVLNDANEWETVVTKKFKTKFNAVRFFIQKMGGHKVWAGYSVVKV